MTSLHSSSNLQCRTEGPPRYTLSDGQAISSERPNGSDREVQLDAMRRWFYENYEDDSLSASFKREGALLVDGTLGQCGWQLHTCVKVMASWKRR